MFENYNETELLNLMLNKDEFILYITQQYNNNDCCTLLEPIIWAVHFNIPKFQRLPLLENILLRSTAYIKKCYSFLPDKQILGKTYEVLGIPTVCGEPNKCFLNAYKKYKPYYPVRYPKKAPLLCNVVYNPTVINPGTKCKNINSTSSLVNLKIICSTPNTKRVHNFEITPLLSPIKTQIQEESYNLPIDSCNDGDSTLNKQNIEKNNTFPYNKQRKSLPRKLELSGFEILNTTQQTLSSIQNGDTQKLNYSNNAQSDVYFISRDPKNFQYENDISKSNMSSCLVSNVSSEESYDSKEINISYTNTTSVYFENYLEKVKYQVPDLKKPSTLFIEKSSTVIIKQSLSEKLKKNSSLFKKNKLVRQSKTSPSINMKTSNPKQTKYNTQKSTSESWTRISETFNEISFSDFDETSYTETNIKHKQSKNIHHNEIEQDSSLEYYDTGEKNVNSWNVESQDNNREQNSILSINSSLKVSNELNNYEDQKIYEASMSHSSFPTFSDTSIFSSNSTLNSDKLVSIQQKFISWSQDSSNAIHYEENYTKQKNGTVIFNNTNSKEMILFTSKQNITMNFSSISSTADTLAYISNFNDNSE